MADPFPIKINHTVNYLPTKLAELEALSKESLVSIMGQLPETVNGNTSINNVSINGKNITNSTNSKSYKTSASENKNDLISITGESNKYSTYKGDDFIFSNGKANQADSGDGNDTILLTGDKNSKIFPGKGDDLLVVLGDRNRIGDKNIAKYTDGNDSIAIKGYKNTIFLGDGADTALISGESSTLDSGAGNDKVAVSGTKNNINTYTGDDIISVDGSSNTINAARGHDNIPVTGDSNYIKGGDGNDSVFLYGINNKILTGSGNDTVTIGSLTEDGITYTAEDGYLELADGNDQVVIENIDGNFTIDGGSGTNTVKISNIDINDYSGNFSNNILELFRTDGTGDPFTLKLTNIESIEFAGNNIFTIDDLKKIQGNAIQFDSTSNVSKITNADGKSNVLQLDINFSNLQSISQSGSDQYIFKFTDLNSNNKSVTLEGIYHLKTSDGFSINLDEIPNFKTLNADISTYQVASLKGIEDTYTTNFFDPLSSQSYTVDLNINKDKLLTIDDGNPSELKQYTASELIFERYANSTAINPGVVNNTVFTNSDGKTNVADFSGFDSSKIRRVERLKFRASETFRGVVFTPNFPNFSTLPTDLAQDITLTFDGVSTLDTVVNNYNAANPTKTVSHNGVGTAVLSNGSVSLNNIDILNNQYKVYFEDGVEKAITLNKYNFIKTAEGHYINLENMLGTLENSLDNELRSIDPTAFNYDAVAHDALKNTQFARGAYNVLSSQNDSNKFDVLAPIGSATYPLLPTVSQTVFPISSITSSPATITPSSANLIDGNKANFYSTAKKATLSAEDFVLNLGAPTQFNKIKIDARSDFNGLFPDSFDVYTGNAINTLTYLTTITAAQAQSGHVLGAPTTAQFVKFGFSNKQLSTNSEYYAEIGEVTLSNRVDLTHIPTGINAFSAEQAPNLATMAIDASPVNYWETPTTVGQTTESITIDLGASKPVSKVSMIAAAASDSFFPTDFSIYVGDNPLILNLASTVVGYGPVIANPATNDFTFPEITGRYVKISALTKLNTGTYNLRIAEIQPKDALSNFVTQPTTLVSTFSSEGANPSSDVSHINDNNVNTFYSSPLNGAPTGHSFTFDLGSSQSITDIKFTSRPGLSSQFPTISSVFIDNNPVPVTAVTGLTQTGSNASFNPILGRYIKVNFTSQQDGTTGNYYSQIAELQSPEFNATVNFKSDVTSLVSSLQDSITFQGKESGYEIDDATKGLFSFRIASILRNRPDVINKIKESGLVVELTTNTFIPNGTKTVSYGGIKFTPLSKLNSGLNDYNLTFDGVQDLDTVVNSYNLANPTKKVSHNGIGTEVLAAGSFSLNNNVEGLATFSLGSDKSYKIQLTADAFYSGALDNEDGQATDIHEMMHVLDSLDGTNDGVPILFNSLEKLNLGTARSNLFAPLSTPLPPLGEGLLYSTGANNPARINNALNQGYDNSAEFLAYATTAFFERGDELVALGADGLSVYNKLSNYFGLATNVADPDVNMFTNVPPVL